MDLGIAGKWALVCGASKGLGFGCAQALVREGVHVVLVARGADALEAAVAKLIADPGRPADQEGVSVAPDPILGWGVGTGIRHGESGCCDASRIAVCPPPSQPPIAAYRLALATSGQRFLAR